MKITLISPPDPVVEDAQWDEPLGLLYLGAVLEKEGHSVQVIDLNFHEDLRVLDDIDADWFGLYCSSSMLKSALGVNLYIKEHHPGAKTMVGGPHATCMPEDFLEDFDRIIVGEGEKAILHALKGSYQIVECLPINDLDTIPYPARHLLPLREYHRRVGGEPSVGLMTSRGCPNFCCFCSKVWGKTIRFRSAGNVIKEVQSCMDNFGINAFNIRDDTFTLNRSRLHIMLEAFSKMDVKWRCLTRVDQVDHYVLSHMKKAGCVVSGTLIVKNCSVIPIELINHENKDKVLTADGEYEEVKATSTRSYKGSIISILPRCNGQKLTVSVTPDHPILVVRPQKFLDKINRSLGNKNYYIRKYAFGNATKNDWEWIPAGQLTPNDLLVYPIYNETKDIIEVKIPPRKGSYNITKTDIPVERSLLRLIGYYLAEGSLYGGRGISFAFGFNEEEYANEVKKLIEEIFVPKNPIRIRSRTSTIEVIIGSMQLVEWFKQFGRNARNKHIPLWIMKLPFKKQIFMLETFWRGDGSSSKSGYEFATSSRDLAEGLKEILLRNNIVPCLYLSKIKNPMIQGRKVNIGDSWSLRVHGSAAKYLSSLFESGLNISRKRYLITVGHRKGFILLPIRKLKTQDYEGLVHNIEVKQGTPSFTTMGYVTLHNCEQIVYGLESGNQQVLNNLGKGTTVEQNLEAIKLTKEAGIEAKAAVIVGSPGETWDTVKDTVAMIENCMPDSVILCTFTPYPGSPVFENPDRFRMKILTRDVSKYTVVGENMHGNVVVETEKMTAEDIAHAHDYMLNGFKDLGLIK